MNYISYVSKIIVIFIQPNRKTWYDNNLKENRTISFNQDNVVNTRSYNRKQGPHYYNQVPKNFWKLSCFQKQFQTIVAGAGSFSRNSPGAPTSYTTKRIANLVDLTIDERLTSKMSKFNQLIIK
ncbi:hypothetical protein DICPUDRAFT_83429 [Dictyostelium purpureum]|uniref:Uncharacterized protein n=1 Tax=Dictyostelium purpureum TaxID=5786 RepID=F0ZZI3_DICPU|nr:uncharacterized protein DICPUDRAFT_83429 [Dictyostelium purpureum]EGC30653.1 hypothetical protein DICPUDRAFT_83429 [Dictyostelium purpureum]|eukprot:XP_003292834.1 hypothetical protein DICPUDRAFT_83429 [Dictyostelium purpureum]